MSIQSVGATGSNQYVTSLSKDFQNLQDDLTAFESAQNTGTQDQVTLSQDALQKAMDQFQSDLAGLTQGTQGHHHHHHHRTGGSGPDTGNTAGAAVSPSNGVASVYASQSQAGAITTDQS